MDSVIESYLREVLSRIEPTKAQRDLASKSHIELRDLLNDARYGKRIQASYLSGSYARHTAIRPIDDVDIIFEIVPEAWDLGWVRQFPNPAKVLDSFAGAARRRYPGNSVRKQRRSVCLRLKNLDIDIVPAIPRDASGSIWIPDRDQDRWLESSPKLHAGATTNANQACGGLAVPAIKLLKQWNGSLPSTTMTKSFIVESAAVHLFTARPQQCLTDCLLLFWDLMAGLGGEQQVFEWWGIYVPVSSGWGGLVVADPARQSPNVATSVDSAHLSRIASKARIARDKVLAAKRARSPDLAIRHMEAVVWA